MFFLILIFFKLDLAWHDLGSTHIVRSFRWVVPIQGFQYGLVQRSWSWARIPDRTSLCSMGYPICHAYLLQREKRGQGVETSIKEDFEVQWWNYLMPRVVANFPFVWEHFEWVYSELSLDRIWDSHHYSLW